MRPRRKQWLDPNTVVLLKQIFIGLLVFSAVAVLTVAVWYGTRVESLTIKTVQVSGGETIKHSDIEKLAQNELEGLYLGIIPLRFSWLYPKTNIIESLEKVERIHNVSIKRNKGTALSIVFDEYTPRALWCRSIESDECLFLDETGYAFSVAPKLTGGSFLRFVQIDQPTKLHDSFVSSESFDSLLLLAELLAKQGWFVSHFELDQVGDAFLRLVDGGELKVTLKQAPSEIIENLQVVISSEKFIHLKPGNFKYIDLRFGNKVFVNEELDVPEIEEIITETSSTTVSEETN